MGGGARTRQAGTARQAGSAFLAQELDEALRHLGGDVVGVEGAGDVHGAAVGVDERDAGGTEVEVDLERPRALGRELAFQVVHEELHALVAARHVRDEFHARSLSSGPGSAVPGRSDRNTAPAGGPASGSHRSQPLPLLRRSPGGGRFRRARPAGTGPGGQPRGTSARLERSADSAIMAVGGGRHGAQEARPRGAQGARPRPLRGVLHRRGRPGRDRPAARDGWSSSPCRETRIRTTSGLWKVGADAAPQAPKQVGLFHVAWQVERAEDLEAFHDALVARGVPVRATMDHGANLSVYFEDPDGHMLEVTYEKPRETWPAGRNPFAGREPLPFQSGRALTLPGVQTPHGAGSGRARPLRGGDPRGRHPRPPCVIRRR